MHHSSKDVCCSCLTAGMKVLDAKLLSFEGVFYLEKTRVRTEYRTEDD